MVSYLYPLTQHLSKEENPLRRGILLVLILFCSLHYNTLLHCICPFRVGLPWFREGLQNQITTILFSPYVSHHKAHIFLLSHDFILTLNLISDCIFHGHRVGLRLGCQKQEENWMKISIFRQKCISSEIKACNIKSSQISSQLQFQILERYISFDFYKLPWRYRSTVLCGNISGVRKAK